MTKDPVLLREKQILKEKGAIATVEYLSSEAKKHPQFSELFYKYYFRSIRYAIKEPELMEETEKSLIGFLDYFDKNNEFPNEYEKFIDFLFEYYINIKDGNSAKQALMRLNKKISPNAYNFLYIQKYIAEKSQSAHLLFNISQNKKDIQYIYDMMMIELLEIAWQIDSDWLSNMNSYEVKKYTKLPYTKFEMFNNIKWEIDNKLFKEEDFLYEYFSKYGAEVIERVVDKSNHEIFIKDLHKLYFEEFPAKIGFNLDFLRPSYKNLNAFGKWFSDKPYTKESYPSIMLSVAHDLANEFTSQYCLLATK
jgi:hypothetical protein